MESVSASDPYYFHKKIWKGEHVHVKPGEERIKKKDTHGNTCLHIAAHFGDLKWCKMLVEAGATMEESDMGWRPVEEAVASGSRECAAFCLKEDIKKRRADFLAAWADRKKGLMDSSDCYFEIKWTFDILHLPFVSGFVPNDTYKVWKQGSSLRVDYTLQGFQNLHVNRGNLSLLLTGGHLYAINHDHETVQDLLAVEDNAKFDEQIDAALNYLLAHDVCGHKPYGWTDKHTKPQFKREKEWFTGRKKKELIDDYNCDVYKTNGIQFRSIIRSDPHAKKTRIPRSGPSEQMIERERALFSHYFSSSSQLILKEQKESEEEDYEEDWDDEEEEEEEEETREETIHSLRARYLNGLVWPTENVSRLTRSFNGKVWLSKEFPLRIELLKHICAAFSSTIGGFNYLEMLLNLDIPKHCAPLKLEVPVFFPVTAIARIQAFEMKPICKKHWFEPPKNYKTIEENYLGLETREMLKAVKSNNGENNK